MTQAKHTPGMWECSIYSENGAYKITSADGHVISEVHDWSDDSPEEAEANARLIAAAPELFEALQDSIDLIKQLAPAYTEESVIGKCLRRYQFVVDKATGA